MRTNFWIKSEELPEFKRFVRERLKNARFLHISIPLEKEIYIELDLSVEDGIRLNELFEKWHNEEQSERNANPSCKKWWKKIINFFKI